MKIGNVLSFVLCATLPLFAQKGAIQGHVVDQTTLQPLIGANIVVKDTPMGASTDMDGLYEIEAVPVGIYILEISYMGYQKQTLPSVVVKTNRTTRVNASLSMDVVEGDAVTVTAGYFSKNEESPVSALSLNHEEIRRSPGAREDVSRMIQNMPGVNMSHDDRNDLIVRGGSPTEVLFMIDHFEVPNPNHFGTQGASGGPISMVNNEFIENVDFSSGGFGAAYGQKLSGVMAIQFREGSRERMHGKLNLDFGGAGGFVEGPLNKGKGSYLLGFHRSYLELIKQYVAEDGLPIYTNMQGKIVYDLNPSNQLNLLFLGGDDKIFLHDDFDIDHFETGVMDTVDYDDPVDFKTRQYMAGINLRTFWHPRLYSIFSVSHTYNHFHTKVWDRRLAGFRTVDNDFESKEQVLKQVYYTNQSVEEVSHFKSDWTWSLPNHDALSFGTYIKILQFDHDITYHPIYEDRPDLYGQNPSPILISMNQEPTQKFGSYLNYKLDLGRRVIINTGVRYDEFKLLKDRNISPRLSLSFNATHRLTLNAGAGRYYQSPEFIYISGNPNNRNTLKEIGADHLVAGFDYLLTENTRFTCEGYYKTYFDYPVVNKPGYEMVSMANVGADFGADGMYELGSRGKGKVKGVDLMIQKKVVDHIWGLASYSFSDIQHTALDNMYRPGKFDNRHVLSLVLGFRLSKKHEFSFKYRYAGGTPYTPFDDVASKAADTGVLDLTRLNDLRYDDYQRLDLRYDSRDFYEHFTLISYMSIENVFDQKNPTNAYWDNRANRTAFDNQVGRFFVGGFSVEF